MIGESLGTESVFEPGKQILIYMNKNLLLLNELIKVELPPWKV